MGQERPEGLVFSVNIPEVGAMLAGGTGLVSLVFPNLGTVSERTRVCAGVHVCSGACSWTTMNWGRRQKTAEVGGDASAQETGSGWQRGLRTSFCEGALGPGCSCQKVRERPSVSQLTLPSRDTTAPRLSNSSFLSSSSVSALWTATVGLCSQDLFLFSVRSGSWWGEARALGLFS